MVNVHWKLSTRFIIFVLQFHAFRFAVLNFCNFRLGSVYFTADFLAATDRLELLCRQSDAIRMKRSVCHAISVLLIVQWLCFMSSMPLVLGSNRTLVTFLSFAFQKTFPLGLTFRVWLGVRVLSVMVKG